MTQFKTLALAAGLLCAALAAQAEQRKTYIVQLKDQPAISYRGTVKGLAQTAPTTARRYNPHAAEVQAYLAYLDRNASSVIATLGDAPVLARYGSAFNGFAAQLSNDQVKALLANGGVARIWESRIHKPATISTTRFLGLSTPGGVWSQGPGGQALKGEDLVIGVVDTGVWPENPAFFDRVDANGLPSNDPGATQVYGSVPAHFKGGCVAGEGIDPAKHCNHKLIGIKHFNAEALSYGDPLHWTEFDSGRDSLGAPFGGGGHGDHTASTVAGNEGVPVSINGQPIGLASGVAPRARVAVYKACWGMQYGDDPVAGFGCPTGDLLAAVNAAVEDGVDAINYSISGSTDILSDPVEWAFLNAAASGVFVAAAAGNSGPRTAVNHGSPWVATIAASTHDRSFQGHLTLADGRSFGGASTAAVALNGLPLVRAEDAALSGAVSPELCGLSPNVLDPAKVAGKIVVCTRGVVARLDKGQAVKDAGGAGMVLANSADGQSLDADFQVLPTLQVSRADGQAIAAFAAVAGAHASLAKAEIVIKPAPVMADFSSRGPNLFDTDILKPDMTAPGVDVIAQLTPTLDVASRDSVAAGNLVPPPAWGSYSGTSMSSPHVAGLALLLKQAHPDWSPAEIKSALMTTATPTLPDGRTDEQRGQLPWAQGAGHVAPKDALGTTLVFPTGLDDWMRYICTQMNDTWSPECKAAGRFNGSYELNLPSITVGSAFGGVPTAVTRSVTNTGTTTATYAVSASLADHAVTVAPATLTLAPGASGSFTVTLVPGATAPRATWRYGQVQLSDGARRLTLPLQARVGVGLIAPSEVVAGETSGSRLVGVRAGYTGKVSLRKAGLKEVTLSEPATLSPQSSLTVADFKAACTAGGSASVKQHVFDVPAGAVAARWELRGLDVEGAGADLDLLVIGPDGKPLDYSGGLAADESITLMSPQAGHYQVCVGAYKGPAQIGHRLSSWIVGAGEGSGLVALPPAKVVSGTTATAGLSWSGLASGKRYFGVLQFLNPAGLVEASTEIRIATDGTANLMTAGRRSGSKPQQ